MTRKIPNACKRVVRTLAPGLVARRRRQQEVCRRQEIEAILRQSAAPDTRPSEADFDGLQNRFAGVPEYGYDARSLWKRGAERASTLVDLVPFTDRPARVLEVGCGDGMTGAVLSSFGHQVTLSDMEDWRDPRARMLPFLEAVLEAGLPVPDATFDLVYSFNSFEHFQDPAKCFAELTRLCRPGGIMHLDFGPLYPSAWGLHAYSGLKMPYPQYLFSQAFIEQKLHTLGISDLGRKLDRLQPLNGWGVRDFMGLWKSDLWTTISLGTGGPAEYLTLVQEYPAAFRGRGLSVEDLTTQWIRVTLRRNDASATPREAADRRNA